MFIECIDVGVMFNNAGDPVNIDETKPEHGQPLLLNIDSIVYVRPVLLEDGNYVTEICYDSYTHTTSYWVQNSYGSVKTAIMQAGKFIDDNVILVKDKKPYENPKSEYDFSTSKLFQPKEQK